MGKLERDLAECKRELRDNPDKYPEPRPGYEYRCVLITDEGKIVRKPRQKRFPEPEYKYMKLMKVSKNEMRMYLTIGI